MSGTSRQTTADATLSGDDSELVPTRELARVLGEPHTGADGRHQGEPLPLYDDDLVGTVGTVCTVKEMRLDAGPAGASATHKGVVDGPVGVSRTGIITNRHGDHAHHGGANKALYVISTAEQRHWSEVLGDIGPRWLGGDLLINGDIDDVEIGATLSIGDPSNGGLRIRVTGARNPYATFARGVGRADWVEVFSTRNRMGVYLSVLTEGAVQTGDEIHVISSPRHRVTCRRWFAHHDPRDAQELLNSEIFGNCVIADLTKKYVRTAAHEQVD